MKPWALVALALVASAAGCERDGAPYVCDCAVITDTDGSSKVSVAVCAPTPERSTDVARGCAQTGAPAKVEACSCKPTGGPRCDLDRCDFRHD